MGSMGVSLCSLGSAPSSACLKLEQEPALPAGLSAGKASVHPWSRRRCNARSLIFSLLAENLKLIVPSVAGVQI